MEQLTQEFIKDLFQYDSQTGEITRNFCRGGKKAGSIAGRIAINRKTGIKTRRIKVGGQTSLLVHLYIFIFMVFTLKIK